MQKEGALLLPPLEHVHEYHCTPVWVRHACRIRTVRPWLTCGCICSPEGRAVVDRVPDGIVQQLIQLYRKEGVHAWSRGTNDLRRTDSCQKRGNHYRFFKPLSLRKQRSLFLPLKAQCPPGKCLHETTTSSDISTNWTYPPICFFHCTEWWCCTRIIVLLSRTTHRWKQYNEHQWSVVPRKNESPHHHWPVWVPLQRVRWAVCFDRYLLP